MADPDIVAEVARLEGRLEEAVTAFRADPADEYRRLIYRGAQEELARHRQFWRGVDVAITGRPTVRITEPQEG